MHQMPLLLRDLPLRSDCRRCYSDRERGEEIMTKERMFSITIDNKRMDVRSNQTILEAARDNGIMIPSLCAMEHLPPYGACRLCVVEVDGLRGFPTSCTTPVENGMVIRTDT